MKKLSIFASLSLLILGMACSEDPIVDVNDPSNSDLVELQGDLTTRTLTADKKYLIVGQTFVREGQVLTVEPGTVILGNKRTRGTLIIDRGGKMMAQGTAERPIVMTSDQEAGLRDKGDWGGLVILGNAQTNQVNPQIEGISPAVNFGRNDASMNDDNSGVYEFLRVEFAGIELSVNNETNSITLGGVGSGTKFENVMVSYGGDDGFEWFGGTVNGKNLISFAMWDDDFDVDFGYSGNVQFGLAVRYPGYADQSESNAFECDNGPNDNDVPPYTTGTFSNFTIIGPIATGTNPGNGNYAHAVDLRRRTAVTITNSVFTGFPRALRMNQPSVYNQYAVAGNGHIANNIFFAPNEKFRAGTGVDVNAVGAYIEGRNTVINQQASEEQHTALGIKQNWFFGSRLAGAYDSNPDFTISGGLIATGAKFDLTKFQEPNRTNFFNKEVAYIGAFGSTDWTNGWAEFDPIDKAY
ncbi:hypothetical protein [Anditalea andensis]|uniref:T9SS C-terminal target domain-containing protein n=1 Tax=Anditalea andensis TaxID=1048983 RepID=A0A074KTF7_9BACT|nr:hypothetical protein [Anditalea andensis]KEO72169.1 hypothetical protein EL17_19880 [Anditalea andensis]